MLLTFRGKGGGGGVVQNREYPDFRSPEVGRYDIAIGLVNSVLNLPILMGK